MDRQGYIGGSDFYELLTGCELRLWLEKRGEGLPKAESGAMKRGKKLEDLIVEEYVEKTGRKVKRANKQLTHCAYPWALGRIDRWTWRDGIRGVLECKSAAPHRFRTFQREGLPASYIAQLQWYLYITGGSWGCYAILEPCDWQCETFDVQRDDALIALLHERAAGFWAKVENGPRPDVLLPNDKNCRGCHNRELCHPFEPIEQTDDFETDDSLIDLVAAFDQARAIAKDAAAYKDECQERLIEGVGSRPQLHCGSFNIINRTLTRKAYTVPESKYNQLRVIPAKG